MKVQDQHKIKHETQSFQTSVTGSAVFHGDCLEIMKSIPASSIDMILCDLPYGTTGCKWDVIIAFDELWKQYDRIIKNNGAIVLFAQCPFDKILGSSKINLLRYEWIWEKNNATGHLQANKNPMKSHENILVFYKKMPTYNPQKTTGHKLSTNSYKPLDSQNRNGTYGIVKKGYKRQSTTERFPRSVLKFNTDKYKNALHPTQKPVLLFEYLIKTYTNQGETVLDNCAGSGTTGIACINTKRNYILIEKEQKYFDIINERIKNHTNQTKLF